MVEQEAYDWLTSRSSITSHLHNGPSVVRRAAVRGCIWNREQRTERSKIVDEVLAERVLGGRKEMNICKHFFAVKATHDCVIKSLILINRK